MTANGKKSAVLRCQDIEAALHSLLFEVLNGQAYCADLDKVSAIMSSVQGLRYRFESYPELPDSPHEARIRELMDNGYPHQVARAVAKDEEACARRHGHDGP